MIHVDSRFPQMADALNPELMAPLLNRSFKQPATNRIHCRIGEKRYKPGKSLLISYRVDTQENVIHSPYLVTGRLCESGEAHLEFDRECAKRPELAFGGLSFLEEPAMVLWRFPYDRKLLNLPKLLNTELLAAQLKPKLIALGVNPEHPILRITPEVLHYLAERSCMIRYRIEFQHPTGKALLYAKNYADEAGAGVFEVMRQLDGQFTDGARALAYDKETHTLWQSHVSGSALGWSNLVSCSGEEIAQQIGRCVARFHACQITASEIFSQTDVYQGLQETIALAERTYNALKPAIHQAVNALLMCSQHNADSSMTPIHHDLKLNNFLLNGVSVALIDMDCVCVGDPMTDLASLIANFYLNGLREGETAERIHPLVNILVNSYRQYSAYPLALQQLRWQVGAALIHEVTRRSLRQLDSQRIQHIQDYLVLSQTFATLSLISEHERHDLI